MRIGVGWHGIPQMANALQVRAYQTHQRIPGAAYRFMEGVMTRSKEEFVPVKTGALKASGRVAPPVWEGNGLTVDAIYGSVAVHYALDQHETPWYFHPVGQWKYLEVPLMQAVPSAAHVMAADLMWQ